MADIPHISELRKPGHDISPIFINRWSPRAMSGEEIGKEELMRLFEAARWAPSSMNNQSWCKNAAVLIVTVSKNTFDFNGKPARTHSYDTGAAWVSLALQGSFMGLVVHGMQGFDYDRAKTELMVNDEHQVEAMIAVGRPGNKYDLPFALEQREFPSDRRKLEELIFEGGFSK